MHNKLSIKVVIATKYHIISHARYHILFTEYRYLHSPHCSLYQSSESFLTKDTWSIISENTTTLRIATEMRASKLTGQANLSNQLLLKVQCLFILLQNDAHSFLTKLLNIPQG